MLTEETKYKFLILTATRLLGVLIYLEELDFGDILIRGL
jgi:hypothetical protein